MIKFLLAGLTPLLAGTGLLVFQEGADVGARTQTEAAQRTVAAASTLSDMVTAWRTELLTASDNAVLRQWYEHSRSRPSLQADLNGALVQLHSLYPDLIDEACYIDRSGAEQARVTKGVVARRADLSPDESGNPFFRPTFALPVGEVYQAEPYISPDSHRWVISNSTPVAVRGRVVALLHFETNLDGLQARLAREVAGAQVARIVDVRTGTVIGDTRRRGPLTSGPLSQASAEPLPKGWVTSSKDLPRVRGNANHWRIEVAVRPQPVLTRAEVLRWGGLVIVAALILLVAAGRFARGITTPLRGVLGMTEALAAGDLTVRMGLQRDDDLGRMADGLDTAAESIASTISGIDQQASQLSAAAVQLSDISTEMTASIREAASEAQRIAAAAGQVDGSVATVAAGTEQLGTAIQEIARATAAVTSVTNQATAATGRADSTVTRLEDSSRGIEEVLRTITSIADQTNLLALNATIEAARAGEAGKGFAVVAGEVKELARQTAVATDDIGGRTVGIQTAAVDATDAINAISQVIEEITGTQSIVASAIEEQSASVLQIDSNATDAATATRTIAARISEIADRTDRTRSGAEATTQAAAQLRQLAHELQQAVTKFRFRS